MIGWRARIGHLAPSRSSVFVYEQHGWGHLGLLILNSGSLAEVQKMREELNAIRVKHVA